MQPRILFFKRFTIGNCNIYGEVAKNCKFLHNPYRCKIEQTATRHCNGIKNSETEICMWK